MKNMDIHSFSLRTTLFSLILLPSLAVLPGLPSLRVDDFILIAWLIVFLTQSRSNLASLVTSRLIILLFLFLCFPVSMLNGLLNEYNGSFGDFNQFVRFFKYVAMYLLAMLVWKRLSDNAAHELLRYVIVCGCVLFLITVMQYFNVLGLNEYYVKIVAPTQYETLVNKYPYPRPVGMIGNPNELGFLFVMLFIMTFFCAYKYKEKKYGVALIVFFMGMLMTMSRGSFLSLVTGVSAFLVVYIACQSPFKKIRVLLSVLSFLLVLYIIAMTPAIYDEFTWRIALISDLASDESFQARLDNWSENIAIIKQHPLLGVGPLRRVEFQHAADNEWLLIWRSYGLVGVSLTICFFSVPWIKRTSPIFKSLHFALVGSSFVYMIPTALFHSLTLFPFMLFLLAMIDTKGMRYVEHPSSQYRSSSC